MKQRDIEKCVMCCKGVMERKEGIASITFFRVKIDYMMVDVAAVQRQTGLEIAMSPAPALAEVMGPDEDMAIETSSKEGIVCLHCGMRAALAQLQEMIPDREGINR